jgi:hypothetical protein
LYAFFSEEETWYDGKKPLGNKVEQLGALLETNLTQEKLNELFHLLKKYDLATPEERSKREEQMELLLG